MQEVKGIKFPFHIDPSTGGVEWVSEDKKIRQNIQMILGVRQGERPMTRDFGSPIHHLVHNPNDEVLEELIKKQVKESLLIWEPRIIITSIQVQRNEGELELYLTYRHISKPISDELMISLT